MTAEQQDIRPNKKPKEILTRLLSLHRGGAGSVFGSVIVAADGVTLDFRLKISHYGGNLIGGVLSDETPRQITERMHRLRGSDTVQLYAALFWEALQEPNLELQWFRYWNLLETIARTKNYEGEPKRDWSGRLITNRRGQPQTIKTAPELVFELLRRVLPLRHMGEASYAQNLSQGLLSQQIPIWYRRRNCVVHGGDCLCRNPHLQCSEPQYINCKKAREEVRIPQFDRYLMSLRDAIQIILASELDT